MPIPIHEKIRVGVSACNAGARVRWNRAGCLDCLEALKRAEVEAFVFMEGSPSCGVYRTTLKNKRLGHPPGVFGALLLEEDLFLMPALDLESPIKWWDWRRRLHAFCWLKRLEIAGKEELYTAWHHLKFLCQEVDRREAQRIGAGLAGLPRRFSPEAAAEWKSAALRLLRKPSNFTRITSIMQKHYAHYRQHFNLEARELRAPEGELSKYKFVERLLAMEKRAVIEGYDFEGAPVLFREKR